MDIIVVPLFRVTLLLLDFYQWAIIIAVVLGWLIEFRVVNAYNRFVFSVSSFLFRITDPALRVIRNVLPALGSIDLSPLVLIVILWFLQNVLERMMLKLL